MDLRHLKIFIAVAEYGSTTIAAQKLFISQPSVSLAITELESYYKLPFFDRVNRKLILNDNGTVMLKEALHILNHFTRLEENIFNERYKNIIQIGFSAGMDYLLPTYSTYFHECYPTKQFSVVTGSSQTIYEKLIAKQIDIAVLVNKSAWKDVVTSELWQDNYVFFCANNHPLLLNQNLEFKEFVNYPFLLREKGCGCRDRFDEICIQHKLRITPTWESNYLKMIIKEIENSHSISLAPFIEIKEYIKSGKLAVLPISNVNLLREVSLAYLDDKNRTEQEADFINLCLNTSKNLAEEQFFEK